MFLSLEVLKSAYFSVFIVLPVVIFSMPLSEILISFLLMHFTAGLVLTIIFQLIASSARVTL
jgi:linoleoyl-CoA desaturase